MQAVLSGLCAPHWELYVWTNDVKAPQQRLDATMASRKKTLPEQLVRVSPVANVTWNGSVPSGNPLTLRGEKPVLFENQNYEFEFNLAGCKAAYIRHRSRSISEAFRFDKSVLRGTLNFGNAIGWFNLELIAVANDDVQHTYSLALEVHATKLDMATDLEQMLDRVESTYPLWRFSYARMTEQGMNRARQPFERIPLLWLEQFKSLRAELECSVRVICNAPHSRLQESSRRRRLEQLHGKLSVRRQESVVEALAAGDLTRRLNVVTRRLSVDTPENRFVLAVMDYCDRELGRFQHRVELASSDVRKATTSRDAVTEIAAWRKDIRSLRSHRLWSEVGSYEGLERESLVLQERAGYSGVYRVWLQLRMYLDVLGRHAMISMKAISELYEIWCFLEILRHLESLGFKLDTTTPAKLDFSRLEPRLAKDGMGAAFQMHRGSHETGDLIVLRLAHEPLFGAGNRNKPGKHDVSWLNAQQPDIVVEATFPGDQKLFWVFDAKYRISRNDDPLTSDETDDVADDAVLPVGDMAPADALNQMHRYRDAIVHTVAVEQEYPQLSRPVIGAFCLFPGWYPDDVQRSQSNPYQDAISAVGIGAFPAVPGQENPWLRDFLASQFGQEQSVRHRSPGPEWQLAQWAPRIGQAGLRLQQADGLVFVAHIGNSRTQEYIENIESGTSKWFHVRNTALVRGEIAPAAMRDVTHCAIAFPDATGAASHITHVYEVSGVSIVSREQITAEQAGSAVHGSGDKYWLFELQASTRLASPIHYERTSPFRAWLTSQAALKEVAAFPI
jgi:hypothetical protein